MRVTIDSILMLVLVAVACAPPETATEDDSTWVGTITTEGNVTTVINESSSVWGGTAWLVEEASIGVEAGEDAYMLGRVAGLAAPHRIYVLDAQVPVVRMYDMDGNHLGDFGRGGQGPGEFSGWVMQLGAAPDGRVFVQTVSKIEVFSVEGELLETRTFESGFTISTGNPMTVSAKGVPYVSNILESGGPPHTWKWGMVGYTENGAGEPIPAPDFDFNPSVLVLRSRMNSGAVGTTSSEPPFAPRVVWALTTAAEMVGGVSDSYDFEIRHADGRVTEVETARSLTPLHPDEADWHARRFRAYLKTTIDPPDWSAADMVASKPAFERFIPDNSGRIWVLRSGAGKRLPSCNEQATDFGEFSESPCWRDTRLLEVFGPDGRFLGSVQIPEGVRFAPRPYIKNDMAVFVTEDEAGTIMVKRYRLVLPEEDEQ